MSLSGMIQPFSVALFVWLSVYLSNRVYLWIKSFFN